MTGLVLKPPIKEVDDAIAIGGVGFGVRHLDDGCSFVVQALEEFHDFLALA